MKKIVKLKFTNKIKSLIYNGFAEHATKQVGTSLISSDPLCFAINNGNKQPIAILVYTEFWGALHIKSLLVDKNYRYNGYGSLLLNEAINYARKKKFRFVFVETMNFQAIDFYRKHGFIEEYRREGYANNTSLCYMRKDLNV